MRKIIWVLMLPVILLSGLLELKATNKISIMWYLFFLASIMGTLDYFYEKKKQSIRNNTWAEIKKLIRWV